jgi:hypothetical protein
VLFSANANSDESLTLGASIGYVNIKNDNSDFDFDANDTGYKFDANYTFSSTLAIEAGYVDFGSPEDIVGGVAGEVDAYGWNIYGVGNVPLSGDINVFAKAGLVAWKATRSSLVSSSTPTTVRISPWVLAHTGTLVNHSASMRRWIGLISTKPASVGFELQF